MRALLSVLEHQSIVLSIAVFAEISEVLGRQKFAAALTPERRQEILGLLTTAATWAEPGLTVTDCVDADDNPHVVDQGPAAYVEPIGDLVRGQAERGQLAQAGQVDLDRRSPASPGRIGVAYHDAPQYNTPNDTILGRRSRSGA